MTTDDDGAVAVINSTCAFFAIMMPLTFAFRGLKSPLSQEITAGNGTLIFATPVSTGMETMTSLPNSAPMTFEALDHPRRSARPGPVEPAPVSAADFHSRLCLHERFDRFLKNGLKCI